MNSQSIPKETILIIDDQPDNVRLLTTMLESQGYQIKKALNGQMALRGIQAISPDLILLDVNMPQMDGYEVCKVLKNDPKTQSIPVIFVSASDEFIDKVKAFQVGGVDYITKPLQLEEIVIRVESQLNQKRLYKKLQSQNELLKQEIKVRERLQSELLEANQHLENLALLDGLTGVANRRKFNEFLDSEWKRLFREKLPLSLILCDVDFFKNYNDAYGHLLGDECLRQVAQTLHCLAKRSSDLVARYGGEEFGVILPNTDSKGAFYIAENMREAVNNLKIPHLKSQVGQFVTLSAGVATLIPNSDVTPKTLIERTDEALYTSKIQGRNRVSVFQE